MTDIDTILATIAPEQEPESTVDAVLETLPSPKRPLDILTEAMLKQMQREMESVSGVSSVMAGIARPPETLPYSDEPLTGARKFASYAMGMQIYKPRSSVILNSGV